MDGVPAETIDIEFDAFYFPSSFPAGDRPGGTASGRFSTVTDFDMPTDVMPWFYRLRIDDTVDFTGSTLVIVENLSTQTELLRLTSEVPILVTSEIVGTRGDTIRITTEMQGSGVGSNTTFVSRGYGARFVTSFLLPEPSSLLLLTAGALMLTRRRRPCSHQPPR